MSDEDVEIAFWFPQGMSLAVAIPFAVYYSLLIHLAISYHIERQRIIEEFYYRKMKPLLQRNSLTSDGALFLGTSVPISSLLQSAIRIIISVRITLGTFIQQHGTEFHSTKQLVLKVRCS